ncbi:GL27177 [Drosophila persimilis]|uniref:Beta-sarcoglycan n=1 Tax=Drosophila persimilis TaxID=7234 RepID=B4GZ60_DROPE|nr:beta-sarcoglycan [Drosophila persimilis]XP_017140721.1 beta-sarcoglycan [Drosophila miranda]EDW28078.1 GL27177 [Drosophila persimilis]
MNSFENTFFRGPSPSYSDDANSENALSLTLPIGAAAEENDFCHDDSKTDPVDYFDEKFDSDSCSRLHPGQHGRNSFAFWTVVIILLALTVGNLILTLTIVGVLRLGKGVHGMELIPEVDVVKFYGSTELERLQTNSIGQVHGFTDVPVTISSDGSSDDNPDAGVHVRVFRNGNGASSERDRIVVDKDAIVIDATNVFDVKDPADRQSIFSTHRPQYNIPAGVAALQAKVVSASGISSPIDVPLNMESDGRIVVKGSEGVFFDAASIDLQAEHHVSINSTQGATVLEAGTGIFLDMDRIPIVSSELGIRTGSVQYKICVCMPQGTLFRIAIPRIHNGPKISCAHFSSQDDPCEVN